MHLPPEVESLVPALISRVAEPGTVDATEEADLIETMLLAGDPGRWLVYLRERGRIIEAHSRAEVAGAAGNGSRVGQPDPSDVARLAGILRDQLALIEAAIDLGPEDLALLESLERLERGEP